MKECPSQILSKRYFTRPTRLVTTRYLSNLKQQIKKYWEKQNISPESMKVLPVNFATEHKQMLSHLALLVSKSYICIPKEHDRLIVSLRTAWANELSLDKEKISYSDSIDALRLACKMYKMN